MAITTPTGAFHTDYSFAPDSERITQLQLQLAGGKVAKFEDAVLQRTQERATVTGRLAGVHLHHTAGATLVYVTLLDGTVLGGALRTEKEQA